MATRLLVSSDVRIKKNINHVSNLLEKIDKLSFVSYDEIDNNTKHDIGVLAQNIYNYFPNMIEIEEGYISNINALNVPYNLITDSVIFVRINTGNLLKNGDEIYAYINKHTKFERRQILTVSNVTENSFETTVWHGFQPSDTLFIYGTSVSNFHRLDISQMASLGAAGVKELYQLVKSQKQTIDQQQQTINSLLAWATSQGFQPPSK